MNKDYYIYPAIFNYEDDEELKEPSKLNAVKLDKNERVVLVEVNMPLFRILSKKKCQNH